MTRLMIILLLWMTACNKVDDGYTLYVIKAGHERSYHVPPSIQLNKNSCDISYKTDESWVWTTNDVFFSEGGSAKIAGFSDGFHRDQSARLGYKHNFGIGVVGLLVEKNHNAIFIPLDTVIPDHQYSCRLSYEDGWYVARQAGNEVKYQINRDCAWGYRLYPCMAGSFTLPHDWNVWLKYH